MHKNQTDDAWLISQTLNGDNDAFAELVDRYKNAVYRHSFAIVQDEDEAEDIAQDTFIAAYNKLSSYNSEFRFATWLFKIASNKALTQVAKRKRTTRLVDETLDRVVSPHLKPHEAMVYGELHDAVRSLSSEYRSVISLYYWQGLSYQEIADINNVPIGTVRGWLSRAKLQLKKELS
ncbi:sigma-70 family RNA polymerase sigma factor [bacterium]|nr:MAG: sigma-70 family RNA polymerase sigma factor [bacterium]